MNFFKSKKNISIVAGALVVVVLVCAGFLFMNGKDSELTAEIIKSATVSDAANFSYEVIGDSISIVSYSGNEEIISIPTMIENTPITKINANAFSGNKKVKGICIPDTVTYIGDSAFKDCENLEIFISGKSLSTIDKYAFANCKSLQTVELQDQLKAIMFNAFAGTDNLYNIYIPSSVVIIDEPFNLEGNKPAIITEKDSFVEKFAIDNSFSYELI